MIRIWDDSAWLGMRLAPLLILVACRGASVSSGGEPTDGATTGGADGPTDAAGGKPPRDTASSPVDARSGSSFDLRPPDYRPSSTSEVMAFPGAEGFGADTPGGRGGRIIEVKNLNDHGPDSFRAALTATGPRIVVFRVSGTITLESDIVLSGERQSYLTVAGQTSPGGVQLQGPQPGPHDGIQLCCGLHDVVIRYLRSRPGPPASDPDNNFATALTIWGGRADPSYTVSYVVLDHCSFEWSGHAIVEADGNMTNLTFQWNIFGDALPNWGAGFFVFGNHHNFGDDYVANTRVTFHHNLISHGWRSFQAGQTEVLDFRNNLIFDWPGSDNMFLGYRYEPGRVGATRANLVNNHFIAGRNSNTSVCNFLQSGVADPALGGGTKLFTQGNWAPPCPLGCPNDWDAFKFADWDFDNTPPASETKYRTPTPFPAAPVTTQPTADVRATVLSYAGARQPSRDSLDDRIIGEVVNRSPFTFNWKGYGPWPVLSGPEPPADRDHDGMPDDWETAHGLNPDDPADGPAMAKNKYNNVENYLNELAGDPVP